MVSLLRRCLRWGWCQSVWFAYISLVYLAWLVQRTVQSLNDRDWPVWRMIAGVALLTFVPFSLLWREVVANMHALRSHRFVLYGQHVYQTAVRHPRFFRVGWRVTAVGLAMWMIGSTVVGVRDWARTDGQAFLSDGRDWLFRDIVPIPQHWLTWLRSLGPDFWHRFFPILGLSVLVLLPTLIILVTILKHRHRRRRLMRFCNLVQGLAVNPENEAVQNDVRRIINEQPDILPLIHNHVIRGRDEMFSLRPDGWFAKPNIVAGLVFADLLEPKLILHALILVLQERYQQEFRQAMAARQRAGSIVVLNEVGRIKRLHECLNIVHFYLAMTDASNVTAFNYHEVSQNISSMRMNYLREEFVELHILNAP